MDSQANERFFNRGFGLKAAIQDELTQDYHSQIVDDLRANSHTLTVGDVTIRLAKEFGFCYGVDKAVDFAYETRKRFPDKRIFLTAEIIHNPRVNRRLMEMGIQFLAGNYQVQDVPEVGPEDVVLLPAFGAPVEELERLRKTGCVLVDTTCGSVVHVWKRVEKYVQDGFTVVVHGKYDHEETRATASHATQDPRGKCVMVWDLTETQMVCDYIVHGGDRDAFLAYFGRKCSNQFDPDRDLARVGVANQTTMLASESLQGAQMIRQAMIQRYGEPALPEHFRSFDTICGATQERQDAIIALMQEPLDLMIIIGGFNSSNTNHLCEITAVRLPTYHIDNTDCLLSPTQIRHKPVGHSEAIVSSDWLPQGPVRIGMTAGASTPNRVIGEVIVRLLQFRGYSLP